MIEAERTLYASITSFISSSFSTCSAVRDQVLTFVSLVIGTPHLDI